MKNQKPVAEIPKQNVNWDWIGKNVQYMTDVLSQAGNLPLDTACTAQELYLSAVERTANAGKQFAGSEKIQCQRCSSPWIAGYFTTRLLSSPRQAKKIRALLKKNKKKKKINRRESRLISAHYARKNILELKCLVCRDKHIEMYKIPYKRVFESEISVEPEPVETTKKKKKKKRKKEVNAGLRLPGTKVEEPKHCDDKALKNQIEKNESSEAMEIGDGDDTENQRCKTTETVSSMTEDVESETDRQSELPEDSLSKRISNSLASLKSDTSNMNSVKVQKPASKARKASKLNTKTLPLNETTKNAFPRMKNQRPKNLPSKTASVRSNPVVQSKKEVQAKIAGLKSAVVKDQMKTGNSLGNFLKSLF